jgi:hypothetical protein
MEVNAVGITMRPNAGESTRDFSLEEVFHVVACWSDLRRAREVDKESVPEADGGPKAGDRDALERSSWMRGATGVADVRLFRR